MDFVIIGGGILGVTTAYHLANEGAKVTIIDGEFEGQATSVAAGMICPWTSQRRNKAWYALARNGALEYPELVAELAEAGEVKTGYKKVGAMHLHTNEKKLEQIEKRVLKRMQDAPEIGELTRLSNSDIKGLFPHIAEGVEAVHVSGGARVNGKELREALLNVAINRGAACIRGEAHLLKEKNDFVSVVVNGKNIHADKIIVTAGAWAKSLIQPLHRKLAIEPQKAQIIHLQLRESFNEVPVMIAPSNKYMLAYENGKVVIGTTYEDGVGFNLDLSTRGVYEILQQAFLLAPTLENSAISFMGVGFRPVAPEFQPIIGKLPMYENVLIANGLGSSGLTVGPYLGRQLANLALEKELQIDLNEYDVRRALN